MSRLMERPVGPAAWVDPKPLGAPERRPADTLWFLTAAAVIGLLLLDVVGGTAYAIATSAVAALTFLVLRLKGQSLAHRASTSRGGLDRKDVIAIAVTYAIVIGCFRIAFTVVDNDLILFGFFATGLIAGVAIPVIYSVWGRHRPLSSLGLSASGLPITALLALVFAGTQFSITFLGYHLPGSSEWVPLLGMALMVGIFESVFFRGFVQGRLEDVFGTAASVFAAAVLYGAYHVGYGMTLRETVFLMGLGVVYAMAYATTRNVLMMWPFLTPLGSLFAQIEDGALLGRLPWAALLGFADVIGVFAFILWRAHRHERRSVGSQKGRMTRTELEGGQHADA